MNPELTRALECLSPIQREAVNWGGGATLVLAGPGAGKTRVLTTRIAKLLEESSERKFRILALTFTTKAAAEMRERAERLAPGLMEERTFIGTFHAFCTNILRQHGSHIGIRPDFGIIDQKDERKALLADALQAAIQAGSSFSTDDTGWLEAIDQVKSRLIVPQKVGTRVRDAHMPAVYQLYEDALRAGNLMDFNGLILEACRLLHGTPAVAARIRQTYPYWLIDEFQDTSKAQYWLLRYLSGGEFKNIMVVADDDQIIYEWAGASYRQIKRYRDDFKPALIQLVENHRCPPEIVGMANRLVAHNTQRTPEKEPTVPGRTGPTDAVVFRTHDTDEAERESLAAEIQGLGSAAWGNVAVLGRTRTLLVPVLETLRKRGVKAALAQRRDSFISPQFVWLQACLDQALRPTNKRVFAMLVNAGNRITGLDFEPSILMAEAEAAGHSYYEHWSMAAQTADSAVAQKLGGLVQDLAQSRERWRDVVKAAIPVLVDSANVSEDAVSDAADDKNAWDTCMREIKGEVGHEPDLSDAVQGIALRSKEPPRDPDAVAVLTVHASKGLEFPIVYLVGLAEGEFPSWQSCKKGDASAEMEEERRSCFVAITRTQEKLYLSSATIYRGYLKEPSRFLKEMGLLG